MKTKKNCFIFVIVFLSLVMLMGLNTFIKDPIFVFRKPMKNYIINDERLQNSGIARNFNYESAILGSSMTENFKTSWFDDAYNTTTVKLSYSGGYIKDLKNNLELMFDSSNNINNVFICLDNYLFDTTSTEERYPIENYVLKPNIANISGYLFNKTIMFNYGIYYETNVDDAYAWQNLFKYGKEYVITSPVGDRAVDNGKTNVNSILVAQNLNNILPYIKDNKETNFKIFVPPYSIKYWYLSNNEIDRIIETQKYVYSQLVNESNVEIYYFQDNIDIITDFNNYKDTIHYSQDINKLILDNMVEGKNLLTSDTYIKRLDDWKVKLQTLDFDKYLK